MARPMPSRTAGISGTETNFLRPGFEMRFSSVMAGTAFAVYFSVMTSFFGNSDVVTQSAM